MKYYLSLIVSVMVTSYIFAAPVSEQIVSEINSSPLGSVIDISQLQLSKTFDILNGNISGSANMSFSENGGTLFYSDDPETVKSCGILYQDTLPAGEDRIYLYHVNGTSQQAKVTAVLKNVSSYMNTVTFLRKSLPNPSSNYLSLGASGVALYYQNSSLPSTLQLNPGESALLDSQLDNTVVNPSQLLAAIYDIESTQSLEVTSLMVTFSEDTLAKWQTLTVSPKDGSNRLGTFLVNSKNSPIGVPYTYSTSEQAKYFEIASNTKYTTNDLPLQGVDAQNSAPVQLLGNYGVTYSIPLQISNDAGDNQIAVLLCPRGGAYAGYLQVVEGNGDVVSTQMIPSGATSISLPTQGAIAAILPLSTSKMSNYTLQFMPAGSTSLPIWLILVPFNKESV